jgi:DNA uptake protein ComE-like DNA-binding protein
MVWVYVTTKKPFNLPQSYTLKNSLTPIFKFNRNERMAIMLLCGLLLALVAANQFWYLLVPTTQYNYSQYEGLLNNDLEKKSKTPNTDNNNEGYTLADTTNNYKPKAEKPAYTKPVIVDINMADSTQLLTIKGIGPAFAGRIVKYRKMLGGFTKKEQLLEVYGFDKERYDGIAGQITLSGGVKKLNLNTEVFKELSSHPYIKYDLTKAIFKLRKKQGPFKSIDDIKQIDLVTDELYNKLAPYLSTQ